MRFHSFKKQQDRYKVFWFVRSNVFHPQLVPYSSNPPFPRRSLHPVLWHIMHPRVYLSFEWGLNHHLPERFQNLILKWPEMLMAIVGISGLGTFPYCQLIVCPPYALSVFFHGGQVRKFTFLMAFASFPSHFSLFWTVLILYWWEPGVDVNYIPYVNSSRWPMNCLMQTRGIAKFWETLDV